MHRLFFLLPSLLTTTIQAAPLSDDHDHTRGADLTAFQTADLVKRVPGAQNDPKQVTLDCIGKDIEWNCNADCMAILCAGKPQILQRNNEQNRPNYRHSGAGGQPFNHDPVWRRNHGEITLPVDGFTSAEEYPFQGSSQGGADAILVGAPLDMQHRQGGAIRAALDHATPSAVAQHEWYKLNFHSNAPYCRALAANDRSICKRKVQDPDPKKHAFTFIQGSSKPLQYTKWSPSGGFKRRQDDAPTLEKRDEVTDPLMTAATGLSQMQSDPPGLKGLEVPYKEDDDSYLDEPPRDFYTQEELGPDVSDPVAEAASKGAQASGGEAKASIAGATATGGSDGTQDETTDDDASGDFWSDAQG